MDSADRIDEAIHCHGADNLPPHEVQRRPIRGKRRVRLDDLFYQKRHRDMDRYSRNEPVNKTELMNLLRSIEDRRSRLGYDVKLEKEYASVLKRLARG